MWIVVKSNPLLFSTFDISIKSVCHVNSSSAHSSLHLGNNVLPGLLSSLRRSQRKPYKLSPLFKMRHVQDKNKCLIKLSKEAHTYSTQGDSEGVVREQKQKTDNHLAGQTKWMPWTLYSSCSATKTNRHLVLGGWYFIPCKEEVKNRRAEYMMLNTHALCCPSFHPLALLWQSPLLSRLEMASMLHLWLQVGICQIHADLSSQIRWLLPLYILQDKAQAL